LTAILIIMLLMIFRTFHFLLFLTTFFIVSSSFADERILSFHSDIYVNPNSSLRVVETIQVQSEQNKIRRGIYREFPTDYKDSLGNRHTVRFVVNGVERDYSPEDYHIKRQSNGVRVYFGRSDRILPPGVYTYKLEYETNRQLGFFEDHNELYWNVTGNGWEFPIYQASAKVYLPADVSMSEVKVNGYTGYFGSKEQDYVSSIESFNSVYYSATKPLNRQEGLTIVTQWPKGYVTEPTLSKQLQFIMKDNKELLYGSAGLLILLAYFMTAWFLVGRDPKAGKIS